MLSIQKKQIKDIQEQNQLLLKEELAPQIERFANDNHNMQQYIDQLKQKLSYQA